MTLKEVVGCYKLWKIEAIETIKREIESIPQNPNIQPIGHRCFTVKFSELQSGVLSAEYYDFEKQKEILIKLVSDKSDLSIKISNLQKIAETGKYKETLFHPDVVKAIEKIVGDLSTEGE